MWRPPSTTRRARLASRAGSAAAMCRRYIAVRRFTPLPVPRRKGGWRKFRKFRESDINPASSLVRTRDICEQSINAVL
ncbi:hypothetical protein CA233_12490 [Sphingomonas sp. ABOLD]|nr:hypothetical protein CA233_12490 [Sphingomonas sp. ABOLD]